MNKIRISVKTSENGERMYYSLVEKDSETGFRFNDRILVMVEEKFLGYITEFDAKDIDASCELKNIKKQVPLK